MNKVIIVIDEKGSHLAGSKCPHGGCFCYDTCPFFFLDLVGTDPLVINLHLLCTGSNDPVTINVDEIVIVGDVFICGKPLVEKKQVLVKYFSSESEPVIVRSDYPSNAVIQEFYISRYQHLQDDEKGIFERALANHPKELAIVSDTMQGVRRRMGEIS